MKSLKDIFESYEDSHIKAIKKTTPLYERLSKHYSYPEKGQGAILHDYSNESRELNSWHWICHKYGEKETRERHSSYIVKEADDKTKAMDSVVHQNKTPHPVSVYAGIKYDPRKKMNKENIIHHPAYMSSSLNKKIAHRFSLQSRVHDIDNNKEIEHHHILKIKLPKGHSGAFVGTNSIQPHEAEMILPRGMNLKYKGTKIYKLNKDKIDGIERSDLVHEHHMDIVK